MRGDDHSAAELVARANSGDEQAWNAMVERYSRLIWSICRRHRFSEVEAADISQTIWLRLIEQLPVLRDPAALPGWIATTTQRECIRVRAAARRLVALGPAVDHVEGADQEEAAAVDEALVAEERARALRAGFEQLPLDCPLRCRQLLALLIRDPPPPYREISAQLGIPIGSIGPHRARCLEKLRRTPALATLIRSEAERDEGGEGHVGPMVAR